MSNTVLRGLLAAKARVRRVREMLRARLPYLQSVADVPLRHIRELAWTVGWTDDIRVSAYIEGEDWRRVIAFAPSIWANKGTHEGTRAVVRALTGGLRTFIGDWHSLRFEPGDRPPCYVTEDIADDGHHRVEIHVEDPAGTLDRDLAADAIDLVRPFGERVALTYVHMIENWDSLARWDVSSVASVDANELVLTSGSVTLNAAFTTYSAAWDHVTFVFYLHLEAGASVAFSIGTGTPSTEAIVSINSNTATNNCSVGGTLGSYPIASVDPVSGERVYYRVEIRRMPLVSGYQSDLVINGRVVASRTHSAGAWAPGGLFKIIAIAAPIRCAWLEALPALAERRTITG